MSLTDLAAHELARRIAARELSCRDVMAGFLARIAAVNPIHNAIVSLRDEDLLLAEAGACDDMLAGSAAHHAPRPFLFGLPQAIKDVLPTAGIRSTWGSPIHRDTIPGADALMVRRMKAAGCIVIGKTNTPEFGLGSHTFNEVFGATRNAFDPSRSAGGSSGGAAVALARRMLPVADGSDSMGSLRNPAGWNNVFGFRPSQGRIPAHPAQDAWITTFGTEGPMARNVRDLALLLDVQSGYDPRAPLSLCSEAPFATAVESPRAAGVRIGWLGDLDRYLAMEPGILDVCGEALARLEGIGARVEPLSLGFAPERIWTAWQTLRHWFVNARVATALKTPGHRDLVKPEALWEHDRGAALTAAEAMAASIERTTFYQHALTLFEQVDFLALPTAQVWPFPVEWRWPKEIAGRAMDTYHRWMEVVIVASFAGLPCVGVPAGFDSRGLPMGLQLIGPPRGDRELLRLAAAYEETAAAVLAVRPPEPALR
ncbi:MAG TPA: amidase [Caldimonas sp.]|jgi:amidase|nr:amidase [Caldimonas sp.]HEX2539631.1 amidase [Caldimonas sp.]